MEAREYNLQIPLQQMALRKIAIVFWNKFCPGSFSSLSFISDKRLNNLVEEMKEKVSLLCLPALIVDKLKDFLFPIGAEILKWHAYHSLFMPQTVSKNELGKLYWTSVGTIDYRKTAERLILLGRVDNFTCYKLSCLYCFDGVIQKFWEESDETTKKNCYYDEIVDDIDYEDESLHIRRANLVTLWTRYLKGKTNVTTNQFEDEPQRTFNQYAFESAALSGNKAATEYFFHKLTFEEREVSLMETAQRVIKKRLFDNICIPYDFSEFSFSDVAIYLLSQMNKAEQVEVFKKLSFATLVCFLDWPWQDLFLDIADRMWKYLSIEEYRGLLTMLSNDRENLIFKHWNMFVELFLRSPSYFRNGLIMHLSFKSENVDSSYSKSPIFYEDLPDLHMNWFCNLITANKSELIKLVLKRMNRDERVKVMTSEFGVDLCVQLVKKDKWCVLQLIIEECELSKESKETVKTSFMEYFISKQSLGYKKRISILKKTKFLKLIDNSLRISQKRRFEELEPAHSVSSKK